VSPAPAVSLVADAAHLASMAVWLGGLIILAVVLLPKGNARELGAILPVWSTWAMMAVIVLALTGAAQAIIEVASFGPLFDTRYGQLVLAKVALLALVLAVAWYSRRLVLAPARKVLVGSGGADPAYDDDEGDDEGDDDEGDGDEPPADPPVKPLRRAILAELAITGVVLAVAAALVQTPPARSAAEDTVARPYTVTLSTDLYRVRLEIDPAQVGGNSLHLYAYNPAGEPQAVVEWKVTATPADGSIDALDIPLLPVTADHAVGEPTFPTPGDWDFKITLRLSNIDQATVTQRVKISD
jgi:copper transport protein